MKTLSCYSFKPAQKFNDFSLPKTKSSAGAVALRRAFFAGVCAGLITLAGGAGASPIATAPAISVPPTSQIVSSGATATFNVLATGTSLVYRWQKNNVNLANGGNISGATANSLAVAGVTASDVAGYRVIITNSLGAVTSSVANLTLATRVITLSGDTAFGNVLVGTSAQSILTISNSGNAALLVSSISYPGGYSGNWAGFIPAGSAVNVTVVFAPTVTTLYGGALTVNANATSGTTTKTVSGDGIAASTRIIGLSGDMVFGDVPVGGNLVSSLTITNSGNSVLTVSSISYPGGFSGNWAGTIPAGGGTNIPVTFAPTVETVYGGSLQVNANATSGLAKKTLSGTGTPAQTRIIGLSGDMSFGSVLIGAATVSTLTIANVGNSPLTVSSISFPGGFSGNWAGVIPAGGETNVTVTFTPTVATSYGGRLTVNTDANDGLSLLTVSGTGSTGLTRIIAVSGNMAFGNVAVGTNAHSTLTIANNGNSPLTVSGIAYPGGFSGNWAGVIPPGNSTNVIVVFAPAVATSYGGGLTVLSDATSGAGTRTVSGNASAGGTPTNGPSSRVIGLGGNLTFGNVAVGASALATLTITNSGQEAFTVTNLLCPGGFTASWSGVVPANSTTNVTVSFTPSVTTAYGGALTVISDATSGPTTKTLSGTGTPAQTRVIGLSGDMTFGNVQVGHGQQSLLVITNTGNAPLAVSGILYPGGFSGNWTGTIPAGGGTNVVVTFAPLATTVYGGTLCVNANASSGTATRTLSGTGTPAHARVISLSGDMVFGNVMLGTVTVSTLAIANVGDSDLTVSNISYPGGFSGNWAGVIPAGGRVEVTVSFMPTVTAGYGGRLTVNTDANGGSPLLTVSGTGAPAQTRTVVLSGDMTFGNVPVGTSASSTLVIANSGNSPLAVSGIIYPSGFGGNWAGVIPAAGFTNVTIAFTPASATPHSGSVTVLSDATAGTDYKTISGTGTTVAPLLTLLRQPGAVVLIWPDTPTGFVLEWATNLPSATWNPNTGSAVLLDGLYVLTNSSTVGNKFYRLKK